MYSLFYKHLLPFLSVVEMLMNNNSERKDKKVVIASPYLHLSARAEEIRIASVLDVTRNLPPLTPFLEKNMSRKSCSVQISLSV